MNPSLPWSEVFNDRYREQIDWIAHCNNASSRWTLEELDLFEHYLDWDGLSGIKGLPWSIELIEKYKKHWNWKELSKNPHLPWSAELIRRFANQWDWVELTFCWQDQAINWTEEMVIEHYERLPRFPEMCVSAKFADVFTEFNAYQRVAGIFNRAYPEFIDPDTQEPSHINLAKREIIALLDEALMAKDTFRQ